MYTLTLDAPAAGAARLRLDGHLDSEAARDLLHAAADVVRCGCSRLVVDLDGLTSWDDDATYAVVGCTRLARWLPQGVDVVARAGLQRDLVPSPTAPPTSLQERRREPPGREQSGTDGPGTDTMAACHAS